MADALKINVTVPNVGQVFIAARALKDLQRHLGYHDFNVEITVQPGKFPGDTTTPEQLAALDKELSEMKASTDQLDKAVKNAPNSPTQPK